MLQRQFGVGAKSSRRHGGCPVIFNHERRRRRRKTQSRYIALGWDAGPTVWRIQFLFGRCTLGGYTFFFFSSSASYFIWILLSFFALPSLRLLPPQHSVSRLEINVMLRVREGDREMRNGATASVWIKSSFFFLPSSHGHNICLNDFTHIWSSFHNLDRIIY